MKRFSFSLSLIFIISFLAGPVTAGWKTTQITNNDFHDTEPVLTNSSIAWYGKPDSNTEIYYYNGQTIERLTNTDDIEQNLYASAEYFAWNNRDMTDQLDNIFLHNSTEILQITTSGTNYRPKMHGNYLVFGRSVNDVLLYDISAHPTTPTQLIAPGGSGNELDPSVHGDYVSFTSNEGDSEIYYYSISGGSTPQKLTDNAPSDYNSQVSDNYIAWLQWDGNDQEIMLYNLNTSAETTVTDDSVNVSFLLHGNYIAYQLDGSAGQQEIYLYNILDQSSSLIASNGYIGALSMSDSFLAYGGHDGNDPEIYVYDLAKKAVTQITDNTNEDTNPRLRGTRLVWQQNDNPTDPKAGDFEIMEAKYSSGGFYSIRAQNGNIIIFQLPGN